MFQNERQELIEKNAYLNIIMHITSVRDTPFYAFSLPETFRVIRKYVVVYAFVYFPKNWQCIPRSAGENDEGEKSYCTESSKESAVSRCKKQRMSRGRHGGDGRYSEARERRYAQMCTRLSTKPSRYGRK